MVQFLQQFGIEFLLLLYGTVTTFLNILTFRRTGKIIKIDGVTDNSGATENKLVKKIEKAKTKLERLIKQATNEGEE